jgi:putative NIF3 family GTP cyclohydrolase 1 type 2
MSFHTRLDIITGGLNDRLAAMLNLSDTISFADGAGRIGVLPGPVEFDIFCSNLKNTLGTDKINAVKARQTVHKIAVVSGSGGDFISDATALGADTFISGECGYHRLLNAKEEGINSFETGHFFTERHAAGYLKEIILRRYSGIYTEIYENNEIMII